jgi:preprotein translocase subunit SecF
MAATHKPFRELVRPGTSFEFVNRARTFGMLSALLILCSIGMLFVNKQVRGDYLNWTIDFKGGTELIFAFREDGQQTRVDPGDVRQALSAAGKQFDVSDFSWTVDDVTTHGLIVRTPEYGALTPEEQEKVSAAFEERFADHQVQQTSWSGDRLFVRSMMPFSEQQGMEFFASQGLEMKEWGDDAPLYAVAGEGTGEYTAIFTIWGLDRQYQTTLAEALGVDVDVIQVYGVGAKAGEQLRNDGIKSMFYVVALIMLYLAFRFDIRYSPGAVAALTHDAILVIGVFAVTWTDVSLTTVAALLTVIGYSVNDTVVIFDRIRENVGRLKDKKLERIINISLNETLSRSLLTSLTLFVVTLMMNIFGTGLVKNFAFAMNIGVIVGVYSSLFVATPVFLYMHNRFYGSKAPARTPVTK